MHADYRSAEITNSKGNLIWYAKSKVTGWIMEWVGLRHSYIIYMYLEIMGIHVPLSVPSHRLPVGSCRLQSWPWVSFGPPHEYDRYLTEPYLTFTIDHCFQPSTSL